MSTVFCLPTSTQPQTNQGSTLVQNAPATSELHYQVTITDGVCQQIEAAPSQTSQTQSLQNRAAMEFYNAGANDIEVHTQNKFLYGTGRLIPSKTSYIVAAGPTIIHYARSASGTTGDLRVTEVGI